MRKTRNFFRVLNYEFLSFTDKKLTLSTNPASFLEKNCNKVRCEPIDEDLQCPDDSVKPQSYIPEGGCCSIQPDCRCKPGLCKPVQCPKEHQPIITKKGDGIPGNCCDHFKCVKNDDNTIEGAMARKTLRCFDSTNNKTYTEGDKFFRTSCNQCECHNGIIKCKEMICPNMKKKCATILKKDECCPVSIFTYFAYLLKSG